MVLVKLQYIFAVKILYWLKNSSIQKAPSRMQKQFV